MKLGKAKYGFTQKKYFKLKDGENIFRILPPMGIEADENTGKWSYYYKIHYGYKNSQGKLRAFNSPEVKNNKTKMIDVPDAALDRLNKLKSDLENAKKAGNQQGIDLLTKLVGGQKPIYNLDKNHYVNAIDSQGNIGVLKLRHKAKQALDVENKKLREVGVDPLDPDNGRLFKFTRTGNALDTNFQVVVAQQKIVVPGVGEVYQDISHKLTAELIARLDQEAAELRSIFKTPSAEEVAKIVASSDLLSGVVPGIDEILGVNGNNAPVDEDEEDEAPAQTAAQVATQTTTIPYVAPVAPVQPLIIPTIVTPIPQTVATPVVMPAPVQTVAPVVAPTVKVVSNPVQTTAQTVTEMSDDEFLKSLGL